MEPQSYTSTGCWYVLDTPLKGTGIITLVSPEGRGTVTHGKTNRSQLEEIADALNFKNELGPYAPRVCPCCEEIARHEGHGHESTCVNFGQHELSWSVPEPATT